MFKIIGEKINGTRKRVARAIAERDGAFIQKLAKKQADAGADWLDLNTGTHPDQEPEDLIWLVSNVQEVTDRTICLDSANHKALAAAIEVVKKTPMINSISGEPDRLEYVLPLVAEHGCEVIALAMDDKKIPETSEKRIEVVDRVIAASRAAGIADDKIYVDPLIMTIATANQSAVMACNTIRDIHEKYPDLHFTAGLSNISFGLPSRKQINRGFLTLAMQAGLDSAVMDPTDKELVASIYTTELLLGRDRHCMGYVRASRKGLFE